MQGSLNCISFTNVVTDKGSKESVIDWKNLDNYLPSYKGHITKYLWSVDVLCLITAIHVFRCTWIILEHEDIKHIWLVSYARWLKILVLVYYSCFTTPYSQPSEHHERVFNKNNNRKISNLSEQIRLTFLNWPFNAAAQMHMWCGWCF